MPTSDSTVAVDAPSQRIARPFVPPSRVYITPDADPTSAAEGWRTVHYRDPRQPVLSEEQQELQYLARERRRTRDLERRLNPQLNYQHERREHELFWIRRRQRDARYAGVSINRLPVPYYPHQNWEPCMVDKRSNRDRYGDQVFSDRHKIARQGVAASATEDDVQAPQRFEPGFIQRMVKARLSHNLTQEQLAQQVARPVNDIQRFEKGELIYDRALKSQLIWKLEN